MESKKVKKNNTKSKSKPIAKKTGDDFSIVKVPRKPIATKKTSKRKSQNSLYDQFSIDKEVADRIDFDNSYNKEKNKTDIYSDINFIPDETVTVPKQTTKLIVITIIVSVFFLIIIFCFIGLFFYRNYLNKNVLDLINTNNYLDYSYEQEKSSMLSIKHVNKDIYIIDDIYKKHKYWTFFLNFIELNTLKDVYYYDMFIDSNNKIAITARTNNYANVAKQIDVFNNANNIIKNVSIDKAEKISEDSSAYNIEFKILLEIDDKILLKNE